MVHDIIISLPDKKYRSVHNHIMNCILFQSRAKNTGSPGIYNMESRQAYDLHGHLFVTLFI